MRTSPLSSVAVVGLLAIGIVGATDVAGTPPQPTGIPVSDAACRDASADGRASPTEYAALPAAAAIAASPRLSMLATALRESGTFDRLNDAGPFTVLAPSNQAFDKLPTAVFDAILTDADLLASLIGFHIIEGRALTEAELADVGAAQSIQGAELTFSRGAEGIVVNGSAGVECGDLQVANGVIHIIDGILRPPASELTGGGGDSSLAPGSTTGPTPIDGPYGPDCARFPAEGPGSITGVAGLPLGDAVAALPQLSTFAQFLAAGGFIEALNEDVPWTIFVPSNMEFAGLGEAALAAILDDTEQLTAIVTYHIVKGQSLSAANLVTSASQTSEQGASLTFASQADGSVSINNGVATVTCSNIAVANGTIHIINTLLVPPAE